MKYLLIISIFISILHAKPISVRQLFNVQTVEVKKHISIETYLLTGLLKPTKAIYTI